MPPAPPPDALQIAQATISMLQTYLGALGGGYAVIGGFFAYKYVGAIVEGAKASGEQAASNREMAEALRGLAQAVRHGNE